MIEKNIDWDSENEILEQAEDDQLTVEIDNYNQRDWSDYAR